MRLKDLATLDKGLHHALLPLRGGGESKGLRPLPPAPFYRLLPPCSFLLPHSSFIVIGAGHACHLFPFSLGWGSMCSWILVSFGGCFWCLGGPWGDFWGPWSTFARLWASKVIPWRSQVDLFRNLRFHLEASRHQLLIKKGGLEHAFSTHAFGMVYGSVLCCFMVLHGDPRI